MTDCDFENLIRPLLEPEDGDFLQVLYVQLTDGTLIPFIGAPMLEEDLATVQGIGLGEYIQIEDEEDFDYDEDDYLPNPKKRLYQ